MRVLPLLLALSLPGIALAQTDFKIYPGAKAQFDQTCTSFTSRCALGGPGGELFIEYPMNSRDRNGNSTDFFRGIGEQSFPNVNVCKVAAVFYFTQDQNCIDQERYDIIIRPLDPTTSSGPDTDNANAAIPPGAVTLLTPPNGPPSPCAWGINVALGTPVTVPCASSIFAGMSLANNSSWVANGQSLQASFLNWATLLSGPAGDPGANDAAEISWQINAVGVKGQCGTSRVWDYGISVNGATLNMAVFQLDTNVCPVVPAPGVGGLYPSNSAYGEGVALIASDFAQPGARIFSFLSYAPSPVPIPLPGLLTKSIWINPSPFVQISFGANVLDANGRGIDSAAFLQMGRLAGLNGKLWFQSVLLGANPLLPLSITNAAATELDPIN